jgi:hypothetical protein
MNVNDPQCRRKRMALNLSYPKSSCAKCGTVIRPGWRCAEEVEAEVAAVEAAAKKNPLHVIRTYEADDGRVPFAASVMLKRERSNSTEYQMWTNRLLAINSAEAKGLALEGAQMKFPEYAVRHVLVMAIFDEDQGL